MWEMLSTHWQPDTLWRIGFAIAAGGLLGIERERHGRAAGLRTTILITLTACLVMLISDSFYVESLKRQGSEPSWHPDPARLAAGALSGMGFLGAGVIIRESQHLIRGVTTAATLWLSTAIGMAFGSGAHSLGLATTASAFAILVFLPKLETLIHDDWYSEFSVVLDSHQCDIQTIVCELQGFEIKVKNLDLKDFGASGRREVTFHLKYKRGDQIKRPIQVIDRISHLPGVLEAKWQA